MSTTLELVRRAYETAVDEQGYKEIDGWTADEVAADMVAYDCDLEDADPAEVARCVRQVREERAR